jgi:valyl-tRNA synthetase
MRLFTFLIYFLPFSLISQLSASLSSDVAMCFGDSGYVITFTGSNGQTPYTFNYTINGGATQSISTSVGNSVSLNVPTTAAGSFNYHLTQVIDNSGATQNISDNAFATVNPLPNVNAGVDQTVCPGNSVTLSGSGAMTYTWNNGVINAVAFVPTSTTVYTVTGTSSGGCTNTDQVTVHVECAGITEFDNIIVKVFPNPSSDFVKIECENVIDVISISNFSGQLIKEVTPKDTEVILDLNNLNSGIYFVTISSEVAKVTKRFIKE